MRAAFLFLWGLGLLAYGLGAPNGAAPAQAALQVPAPALADGEMRRLLGSFAAQVYGRGFRELGVESDCDHGHLLYAPGSARPFAVLYHTQELGSPPGPPALDPGARNWLQRLDTGKVEDARRYRRLTYPQSAYWDWFRSQEVPRFESRRTIVSEMLDPALLGSEVASARQWTFTRVPCGGARGAGSEVEVRFPDLGRVCLETSWQ